MNEYEERTRLTDVDIVNEMKKSYLDYSMSVIVGRALPDVRDGLKPVHRRILYAMYKRGLTPSKPYFKSATTVGDVLGNYHPHGDASVYDAMVRMAQDFSLRYMLIDGHGNFGSIDGYPAAAYRYTEARLSKIALEMLRDIDKDTVPTQRNFDDRLDEPVVLPSRIPALLVNGSQGIAVGMATNIPPHNLAEVIDGMCCLIDNPDATVEELCKYIKGPDFPTGGIIMGYRGIKAAYATGKGHITVRGRTEVEEGRHGAYRIVITEIPYMVNKQNLVKSMVDLVRDKRIDGIDDIIDHSSRTGMRITVELKRGANPQVVLNQLYSYTQLQTTFGCIMLALDHGEPKTMNLREMLKAYIDYQCEVIERRTRFDLKKAKERAHICEALKTAIDFIDEVIEIIRSSKTVAESKERLMKRFSFDDIQADAIVQMRLGQLTGLERDKIAEELSELLAKIKEYEGILADEHKVLEIVKDEALAIRDKYNDPRRTEITAVTGEVDIEDLIPQEECVLTLTHKGYMKRIPSDTYRVQGRGGRGVTGLGRRDEDFVEQMFTCSSHDYILFFSDKGRVYRLKAYEVPEGSRTAKGMNLVNLLPLEGDEKITATVRIDGFEEGKYLCMITKNGTIKRTELTAYNTSRKGGIIAISLDEGDELRWVAVTNGNDELIVATKKGMAIRFDENDARPLSRQARGVRAISLSDEKDDEVIGMAVVDEGKTLLTVTETGYGRLSAFEDYRMQSRGGKGTINYHTEKFGDVASVRSVSSDEDIILISSEGIIIRIPASGISTFARGAKGVRVMRTGENDHVVTVASAEHEDEEEEKPEDQEQQPGGETAVDGTSENSSENIESAEEPIDSSEPGEDNDNE